MIAQHLNSSGVAFAAPDPGSRPEEVGKHTPFEPSPSNLPRVRAWHTSIPPLNTQWCWGQQGVWARPCSLCHPRCRRLLRLRFRHHRHHRCHDRSKPRTPLRACVAHFPYSPSTHNSVGGSKGYVGARHPRSLYCPRRRSLLRLHSRSRSRCVDL